MTMTRYQQELADIVAQKYGNLTAEQIVAELCRRDLIDHTICKVLVVRRMVDQAVRRGDTKTAAMWLATDHFCVTYEYVRKCIYYYTDVNL